MATTRVLITGGLGLIGHHYVEHVIRKTDWDVIIIDKLSYASRGFDRLRSSNLLRCPRIQIFTWDLVSPLSTGMIKEIGDVNIIVHMAAATHVDNSIKNPKGFIINNVMSTLNILEYARSLSLLRAFLYFSTDEVYGPAADNQSYSEWDRHRPTNPYSASKSASENICLSYQNTYKLPCIIINVMNAFSERQHCEKFIPKVIKAVLNDEIVPIHCDENNKPGSRFYIHCRNIAAAVMFILEHGQVGEKYNVTGEKEVDNLSMAQMIADIVGKPLKYELVKFDVTRLGHDLRYALDGSKMKDMGWELPVNFEESLTKTIEWTLANREWLEWESEDEERYG